MTILSAQSIWRRCLPESLAMISPCCPRTRFMGMTYGIGPASYDIRLAEELYLKSGEFKLGSSLEHFCMPHDVLARVADKSTWARKGLVVQNTVIEPGWRGHLTLELTNHGTTTLWLDYGVPIAAIIFELLDEPTQYPYDGKYQDQPAGPQPAKMEDDL